MNENEDVIECYNGLLRHIKSTGVNVPVVISAMGILMAETFKSNNISFEDYQMEMLNMVNHYKDNWHIDLNKCLNDSDIG